MYKTLPKPPNTDSCAIPLADTARSPTFERVISAALTDALARGECYAEVTAPAHVVDADLPAFWAVVSAELPPKHWRLETRKSRPGQPVDRRAYVVPAA